MVTLFFKKNKFLEHYRNILIFKIFFRNFIQVFNFGHLFLSIFKNLIRLLKILFQLIDIIFELKEKKFVRNFCLKSVAKCFHFTQWC